MVVFHWRLSAIKSNLTSKVVSQSPHIIGQSWILFYSDDNLEYDLIISYQIRLSRRYSKKPKHCLYKLIFSYFNYALSLFGVQWISIISLDKVGLAVFELGTVVSDLSDIVNNTSLVAPAHSLNTFNAVPPAKSKMAAGGSIMADGPWSMFLGTLNSNC